MSGPILNCINSIAARPPTVVRELALISGMDLVSAAYSRLADRHCLVLLFKMIAENYRVVQRQRQLQNTRDRVGDKRYFSEYKITPLIEYHGSHEREQQHRHLAVGLRSEQQHYNDYDRDIYHYHAYLAGDRILKRISKLS